MRLIFFLPGTIYVVVYAVSQPPLNIIRKMFLFALASLALALRYHSCRVLGAQHDRMSIQTLLQPMQMSLRRHQTHGHITSMTPTVQKLLLLHTSLLSRYAVVVASLTFPHSDPHHAATHGPPENLVPCLRNHAERPDDFFTGLSPRFEIARAGTGTGRCARHGWVGCEYDSVWLWDDL
jgi:hypothetical protein